MKEFFLSFGNLNIYTLSSPSLLANQSVKNFVHIHIFLYTQFQSLTGNYNYNF